MSVKAIKYFLFYLFFNCYCITAYGQSKYQLHITTLPKGQSKIKIKTSDSYPDSLSVLRDLDKQLSEIQFQGYLQASISASSWQNKTLNAVVALNEPFIFTSLSQGNVELDALLQSGFKEKLFNNQPFNQQQLKSLFHNLLSYYESNGYPFAVVGLTNIELSANAIKAALEVNKNQRFIFDSIAVAGNLKISSGFLQAYLGVKKGFLYSEPTVQQLQKRLSELQFLTSAKDPQVEFSADKARVSLFLNKKNANQFDGILGFIQNVQTGKLQVTGDFKLRLENTFKNAELINFNYKGLPNLTRELNLDLNLPNLFSGKIGLNGGFNLYKQDTSYQNVNLKLGLSYNFSNDKSLTFFIDNRTGNPVSVNGFKNSQTLPPFADVKTTFYGIGAHAEKLDYRLNPTKGFRINADASAGKKIVKQNTAVNPDLYQGFDFKSSKFRLQSRADFYIPAGKRSVINLANQTGILIGKAFFDNELFRLGGFNDLRGFNELSILASSYTFFNAEYRYLLDRNSYVFVFYNQAIVQQTALQVNKHDTPLGFGSGINFETKAGIVSISYAVGKQKNIPVNLQRGKIHFGLIALF